MKFSINRIQLPWAFFRWWGGYQGRGSNRPSRNLGLGATMKPGDEILIRAKLINVRERDNEATVGFDSTTTVVVPLGAVGQLDSSGLHKLWRISQAVKLHSDPAQLQQFYDYVKGVVGKPEVK